MDKILVLSSSKFAAKEWLHRHYPPNSKHPWAEAYGFRSFMNKNLRYNNSDLIILLYPAIHDDLWHEFKGYMDKMKIRFKTVEFEPGFETGI